MTESVKHQIQKGVSAWEREEYQEALDIFEGVVEGRSGFPDVHHKIGLCRAMLDDAEGAIEAFDKALEYAPTYAEAHLNRGILLHEMGRHEEAAESIEEAGRLDTRDGTGFPSAAGNQIAVTHAKLGDLYMIAGRPERAVQQYRHALEVRPRFLDIRGKLAEALMEQDEVQQAREELEAVLEKNPGFTEFRIRLGAALQRLGDEEAAAREWRRAAEEAPDDMRPKAYLAGLEAEA